MAKSFDEIMEENMRKAEEKIVGSPRERLDKIHFFVECHSSSWLPHTNLLSDFDSDSTFLTKDRVEKIVAEAKIYEIRFLVHFRAIDGGAEYVEQFCCRSRKELGRCTQEYNTILGHIFDGERPENLRLAIVSIIDLARISPNKLQKWIDSFYVEIPDRFNYMLRGPHVPVTNDTPESALNLKIREAKGCDDIAC